MSVRVMSAVWTLDLPDSEKIVLLALADCANDEGGCWPSMVTLAKKCSKSDRTVQASIKDLVARGHLTRNEKPGKGCSYIVHPSATPEAASPRSDFAPKRTTPIPEAASDKPSRTIKVLEANASTTNARAKFLPPLGVEADQWKAFCQQRKKKLNERAYTLLCNKLTKLIEAGHPPGDMIDLAIERGWETVFEPWSKPNGRPPDTLRGHRPDPALDLYRAGVEQERRENEEADRRARSALPSHGTS